MSETMVTVRDATVEDTQELNALGRSLYRTYFRSLWSEEGFSRFVSGEFDEGAIRRDLFEGSASYFLVDLGGVTVGFAKTKPQQTLPCTGQTGTLLEKQYFLPDHTSRGWGQSVIEHLVGDARAKGAEFMWLEVLKTNERARRAYEKAGFTLIGEIPFSTDQQEIGFFIMSLRLDLV